MDSKDDLKETAAENEDEEEDEHDRVIAVYEERIRQLMQERAEEADTAGTSKHILNIEALLEKLADSQTQYTNLLPDYEQAKERIRELEAHLEALQQKLSQDEDEKNKMYLATFGVNRGDLQWSGAVEEEREQNRVSVVELMQQLEVTQSELENVKVSCIISIYWSNAMVFVV